MPAGDQLLAGTTYFIEDVSTGGRRISFTVPGGGWFTFDTWLLGKDVVAAPKYPEFYDVVMSMWLVGNVYTDNCHWHGKSLQPPVGPKVDDLANALVKYSIGKAGGPVDVTVAGYHGKKVDLDVPASTDVAKCDEEEVARWSPMGDANARGPYTYGNHQHDTVYIVDVDGQRQVIETNYQPGVPNSDLAELAQLVESLQIEP